MSKAITTPSRLHTPVVIMGVSGAGKSSIGAAVAAQLAVPFLDADDLHPAANKAKMAAGVPLTDADREPWLDAVARAAADEGGPSIIACSSLRRLYRERLRAGIPGLRFVELDVSRAELQHRLQVRVHEFMSPTLLDSQLATLEPLESDEPGIRIDADAAPDEVIRRATAAAAG